VARFPAEIAGGGKVGWSGPTYSRIKTLVTTIRGELEARLGQENQATVENNKAEAPGTFRFPCHGCGKSLKAHERHIGKNAKCPRCHLLMVVAGEVARETELQPALEKTRLNSPQSEFDFGPMTQKEYQKEIPPHEQPYFEPASSSPPMVSHYEDRFWEENEPLTFARRWRRVLIGLGFCITLVLGFGLLWLCRGTGSLLGGPPPGENPVIGKFQVLSAQPSPFRLSFSLKIDPSKSGVTLGKSSCWACPGSAKNIEGFLPTFKKWQQEGGGIVSFTSRDGFWLGQCNLKQTSESRIWTGELDLGRDMQLLSQTTQISFVLLDDQGNTSNVLSLWIDVVNGKVIDPPANAEHGVSATGATSAPAGGMGRTE
jgi:hypothetical protein